MSVASEIQRLQAAKADIKTAIEGKGITVSSSTKLSEYANLIALIDGSGGGNLLIIDDEDMTDINKVYYIDHTGHIHYQYTLDEFLELEEEPANPSFTGLTPTGWLMSLSAAQAFVRANGYGPIIGLTYTTNDGTTRVYIKIDDDYLKTFKIYYSGLSNANKTKLQIDWGDGSAREASTALAGSWVHTYALLGEYVIKYIPEDSTVAYIPCSESVYSSIFGYYFENPGLSLQNLVTKIEFGGNISGNLGNLLINNCESISIPYGCSVNIAYGKGPEWVFSTSGTPASLNLLGNYLNCAKLKATIIPEGVTTTGSFNWAYSLNRIVLPSTLTAVPIFSNCLNLKAVNIPSDVTSLSNNTFLKCISLKKIIVPNKVTTLGTNVFQLCLLLKEISLPSTITTMGNYVFDSCYSLETITLPSSLTSLGQYAFLNCWNLSGTITIPNGVTNIQTNTFYLCLKINKIILPNTVTTIGQSAFANCFSLTEINFPSSLTTLTKNAFNSCFRLSGSINLPTGVTSVPNACFWACYSITGVNIPNTVTIIEANAFYLCFSLEEILFAQTNPSLTSIGLNAFFNCFKLSGTINIPEGVTTISAGAFLLSIYKVTEIIIPSTVTSIGNYAFSAQFSCLPDIIPNKIVRVKATNPPAAGSTIFGSLASKVDKLTIYVPAASVDTYKAATNWKTYKDIIFAEPTT